MVEPALQALLMGNPRVEENAALKADVFKTFGSLLATKTPGEYALQFIASVGAPAALVATLKANPEAAARTGQALLQAKMAPPEVLRQAAETVRAAGLPVLVLTGGWSPTFEAVGEIAAELTGGRHVIVPAPDHFVQASNAEGFNAAVGDFLRDVEAARA
jgi:pimeloyl-ACP methyl ester carboxylesterase